MAKTKKVTNGAVATRQGAQGDILCTKIERLPKEAAPKDVKERVVLSNSETGHVHAIDTKTNNVQYFTNPKNPMVQYVQVNSETAEIVHHRSYDTHKTLVLTKGTWEITRQRENTPEGWRQVVD